MQNGSLVDVVKIEVTNSATGAYTVTHLNQVYHPTPGASEEEVTFTINYEVTDKDNDTDTATLDIGQNLTFVDDGPTIDTNATATGLSVDETTLLNECRNKAWRLA